MADVAALDSDPGTTTILGDPGLASKSATVIGLGLSTLSSPVLKINQYKSSLDNLMLDRSCLYKQWVVNLKREKTISGRQSSFYKKIQRYLITFQINVFVDPVL